MCTDVEDDNTRERRNQTRDEFYGVMWTCWEAHDQNPSKHERQGDKCVYGIQTKADIMATTVTIPRTRTMRDDWTTKRTRNTKHRITPPQGNVIRSASNKHRTRRTQLQTNTRGTKLRTEQTQVITTIAGKTSSTRQESTKGDWVTEEKTRSRIKQTESIASTKEMHAKEKQWLLRAELHYGATVHYNNKKALLANT